MDIQVMSDGKVYQGDKELTQYKNTKGYWNVWVDGKNKKVHRLVALFHIPNPHNKPEINHKDGNKDNNDVSNLEWVTTQENRDHAIENKLWGKNILKKRKLTDDQVVEIRTTYKRGVITQKTLSEMYGVSKSVIKTILNNTAYTKTADHYGM